MFDNICKYLAETFSEDYATWLLGKAVTLTTLSPKELSLEPIRVALSLDKMGDKAMKANLTNATAVFGGLLVLNLGKKIHDPAWEVSQTAIVLPLIFRCRHFMMTNDLNLHPQYITNESGEKTAVILTLSEFEELLEDIEDLAILVERKSEPTLSHEEVLVELAKDGLL